MRIGELLVRQGLITRAQLEQALRAQVIHGGRLGTVLVELGHLGIDALAEALGRLHGMPAALQDHFARCDRALQQRLSAQQAALWRAIPIARVARGGSPGEPPVAVAVMDPLSPDGVRALEDALAGAVVCAIAPQLRVLYHLEHVYGLARSTRFVRLPDRLAPAPGEDALSPDGGGGGEDLDLDITEMPPEEPTSGSFDIELDDDDDDAPFGVFRPSDPAGPPPLDIDDGAGLLLDWPSALELSGVQPTASPPASPPDAERASRPASQPSLELPSQPASRPASQPSLELPSQPASRPVSQPSLELPSQPASRPASQPAREPSGERSTQPPPAARAPTGERAASSRPAPDADTELDSLELGAPGGESWRREIASFELDAWDGAGAQSPARNRRGAGASGAPREPRRFVEPISDVDSGGIPRLGRIALVRRSAAPAAGASPVPESTDRSLPTSPGDAIRAIRRATGRDRVGELIASALEHGFDDAFAAGAVLIVRGSAAIGWKGFVRGHDATAIEMLVVPLDRPSILERVYASRTAIVGVSATAAPAPSRVDRRLWQALETPAPRFVAALPVALDDAVACLIYAHGDGPADPLDADCHDALAALADATSRAFSRLIRAAQR